MKGLFTISLCSAALFLAGLISVGHAANYCLDANNNDLCPNSIHTKHQAFMDDCKGCHDLSSSFVASNSFFKDSSKRAFQPGGPAPIFVPSGAWSSPQTTNPATCSNIACHNIPPGTFTYYIYDYGIDASVPVTVSYGGMSNATAKWQDDPATNCNSCHGNPPLGNVWHNGSHGNGIPGGNNCETCHPDAKSNVAPDGKTIVSNYITAPSQHQNGTVNVVANFNSNCFGCH
ncbi:cytochrome c [Citrifermentans bemidjiense Bem]|uniref:Cytochrome c n=1 Tax=Citrifermentans bemidjiense (strain ATCC BAA-1014 / DSM 16622 / JCM 12645 / Bem) TaxID=404380 RepID=B5EHG0_CITBB|nr:cytochrome c [Citrifermentans bemidjiense Bem]